MFMVINRLLSVLGFLNIFSFTISRRCSVKEVMIPVVFVTFLDITIFSNIVHLNLGKIVLHPYISSNGENDVNL